MIVALLGVLTAVLVVIFVLRLSRSPQAKVQLGTETLVGGFGRDPAAADHGGRPGCCCQRCGALSILFVQHLGPDPIHGWLAFAADRQDGTKVCSLQWRPAQHDFVDPCDGRTFPADGQGLDQYPVTVDSKGRVIVDPRQPTGTIPRPA